MNWYADDVEVLPPEACWHLMKTTVIGRLAVVVSNRPEIFPINYVVDHATIVFRSAHGTKVIHALTKTPVAVETDGYESSASQAWSVVVTGTAEKIPRGHELFETLQLPLFPWHPGRKDAFIRITPDTVSGRRFSVADPEVWNSPLTRELRTPTGPTCREKKGPAQK